MRQLTIDRHTIHIFTWPFNKSLCVSDCLCTIHRCAQSIEVRVSVIVECISRFRTDTTQFNNLPSFTPSSNITYAHNMPTTYAHARKRTLSIREMMEQAKTRPIKKAIEVRVSAIVECISRFRTDTTQFKHLPSFTPSSTHAAHARKRTLSIQGNDRASKNEANWKWWLSRWDSNPQPLD